MNGRKKILITGAGGNLGRWIADHLSSGHEVVRLLRGNSSQEITNEAGCYFADINDGAGLKHILEKERPAVVIHLASVNESFLPDYGRLALQVNTGGTATLLRALDGIALERFIYFSTFHIYGKDSGTVNEELVPAPLNDYAITHFFAEEYVKMLSRRKFPYTIFRLSNSYGCPKDMATSKWYLLFNDLCRQAFENKQLVLKTNGKALRDFISMGQVAEIVEAGLADKRLDDQVINLGSGSSKTLLQVAGEIREAYLSFAKTEIPIRINEEDQTIHSTDLVFSVEKLRSLIPHEVKPAFREEAIKIFELLRNRDFTRTA